MSNAVVHQKMPAEIQAVVVLGEAVNAQTTQHVRVLLGQPGAIPMVEDVATGRIYALPWTDIVDMAQAAFDDPANAVPTPTVQ